MDLAPCVDENDTPFLIDSGTESITESPLDTEHSEDSTVCDLKIDTSKAKPKVKLSSLLDKSFSIDEDDLCTPLEPTPVGIFNLTPSASPNSITSEETTSEEDDGIEDIIHMDMDKPSPEAQKEETTVTDIVEDLKVDLREVEDSARLLTIFEASESENDTPSDGKDKEVCTLLETPRTSILRKSSCFNSNTERDISPSKLHVFFPSEESSLVSFKEPENNDPWIISNLISSEEILKIYQDSCKKHKTIELDAIKSQIAEIKNNMNHSATLKLSSIKITSEVNETLEDILKVTNFHTLILQECQFTPETITEFLNVLEYYKSVCHFEIAMRFDDDDTWKCFCSACSNITVLESLSFKGMVISEPYMRHLINVI